MTIMTFAVLVGLILGYGAVVEWKYGEPVLAGLLLAAAVAVVVTGAALL
jgi:hypothetical protein